MTRLRKKCPICEKSNMKSKMIINRDFSGYKSITPFTSYNVYACNECGMVYAGDIEENIPLDIYYDQMSKYEGDIYVLSPVVEACYEREALFIEKYVNKNARILDIGCAFGGFLNVLKQHGFRNVEGLELSKKNAKYAKEHYDIDVHIGGIGYDVSLPEKYNLVILNGTLEHLLDIRKCIAQIKTFLNDDGRIFLQVPAVEDFASHTDLYQEFSTEHINYFSMPALSNLMRLYGMKNEANTIDHQSIMGLSGNSLSLWKNGGGVEIIRETPDFSYIDRYMDQCKKFSDKIINELRDKDYSQGFYIWGAGTQTAMLYQMNAFPHDAVKGIIDSNANYQGKTICGNEIIAPAQLKRLPPAPILISAQYAQNAIIKAIHDMGIDNDIWTLM